MGRAGDFPVKPHAMKVQQPGLDIRVTVSVFLKRDQNVSGRIGYRVGDNQLALFRSRLCEDKLFLEGWSPSQPSQLQQAFTWEKVDPFARAKSWQQCSRMLYAWRKVGTGDMAKWVTHLAEPTFSICEWFAKFCKEMLEKFTRPGQLGQARKPSTQDNFFPHKLCLKISDYFHMHLQKYYLLHIT